MAADNQKSTDREGGRNLWNAGLLIGAVLFAGTALNLLGAIRALMN